MKILKMLTCTSYWETLWKAIKGERWIDYDYFSWSFDEHMVIALKELMKAQDEHVKTEYNCKEITSWCDKYLENLYEWNEDNIKERLKYWKKITEFIDRNLWHLWR